MSDYSLKTHIKLYKWELLLIGVLIAFLLFITPASAFSGSGAGTSGDPYQITTISQWNEMQDAPTSYYKLMNDLDWGGATATQVGHDNPGRIEVNIILDGNGKTIKNIVIPVVGFCGGLFYGSSVNIHDLTLVNCDITSSYNSVGRKISFLSPFGGGNYARVFIDSTSSITVTGLVANEEIGSFSAEDVPYIVDCGSLATITVDNDVAAYVAGIIGKAQYRDRIDTTYFGGTMVYSGGHANLLHGAFASGASGSGDFYYCYWDATKTTDNDWGAGANQLEGKTTTQMKTQGTFGSWTFDSTHWKMSYAGSVWDGYPIYFNTGNNFPPAPVASFTMSTQANYPGSVGLTVTDTSTNTPTSWAWSWGDATSNSTTQNPSHNYGVPASTTTYTVTLTATNAGGSGSTTNTTVFYITPVSNFTADKTQFVAGGANDQVTFTDFSTNTPTSWLYEVTGSGHPANATTQNPVITFTNHNVYDVRLTATNPAGSGVLTRTWYIYAGEAISGQTVSDAATNPISVGDGIVVGGSVTGEVKSYLYDFGDGSTSDSSAYHVYSSSGTFDVSYGVEDYDSVWHYANVSDWITVSGPVTANFSMNQSTGEYPLTVAFTDTSTGGTYSSAVWNFGDGGSSAVQNPTHTFTTAGTYSVSLFWTNTATESGYATHNVVVTTPASPTAGWSANVTTGLYPLTVAFTDTTTGGVTPYASHAWTFGDGGSSAVQNPTHTFTSAGYFTVTETVTDGIGHSDYHQATIHPYAAGAPSTDFNMNVSSGNAPLTVAFTDTSTGSPDSWNWTFGDSGTSVLQNVTHVYAAAGTYSVTLTTHTTGGYSALTKTVTVLPTIPVAAFSSSVSSGQAPLTVTFTDSSSNTPTSWLWSFGGDGTSALENPTHSFTSGGNYSVSLTATNSGGSSAPVVHYVNVTPSGTPSASPNGTFVWGGLTYSVGASPSVAHAVYPTTISSPLTPDDTWLGDSILAFTNTSGVTSVDGYIVNGWKLAFYKQQPYAPGAYQTPVETVIIPMDAVSLNNLTVNTTGTIRTDILYGNATYLLNLFAINNSYVAPSGSQNYGQGLILAANDTVTVEYSPPYAVWTWAAKGVRNPAAGETVTGNYYLNSFAGQVRQNTYYLYVEVSRDGGANWQNVAGFWGLPITTDGSVTFTTTRAEILRMYLTASYRPVLVQLDIISSYPYDVTVDAGVAPTTGPTFVWTAADGHVITGAYDTDKINFGLDTGNAYVGHHYNTLKLLFQKYNEQTGVWDTLDASTSAFVEGVIGAYSDSSDTDNSHAWGSWQIKASAAGGNFYVNTLETPTSGKYRAEMIGTGPSLNELIFTSPELTVSTNPVNPANAANAVGGWMGIDASGGTAAIFFGLIIMIVIALVLFLLTRNVYGLIGGAAVGFFISWALALFPAWMIYALIASGIGVVALVFLLGRGSGEEGGE